jgi:Tol biopolymer transport system component
MHRSLIVLLGLAVALAACATTDAPGASVSERPEPSASPSATADSPTPPGDGPAATPSQAPTWEGHPAAGLALLQVIDRENPVTQIFSVEADGSLRQVSGLGGALGASHAVWSRDGSQIAFGGAKFGETTFAGQIGVVNADGSGERQLGEGQFPQWSPDGTRIAYTEVDDITGEDLSMYVVDVGSGEITDLGLGYQARWRDGDRLVYNANLYADDGAVSRILSEMDLATAESRQVGDDVEAYPSPDGSMVLLVHEGVISVASAGEWEGRELANGFAPVWSPDGTMVALGYDHDNDANPIHAVVDLEGNTVQSGIIGATPTWSPDGTRLALEVYRPDMPVVQVVDIASGEVVWEMEGMQPAWRP